MITLIVLFLVFIVSPTLVALRIIKAKEKKKTFMICGKVITQTRNELFVRRENNGAILSVISYSEENPFSEYDFNDRKRYAFPCSQGNNLQEFIFNKKPVS